MLDSLRLCHRISALKERIELHFGTSEDLPPPTVQAHRSQEGRAQSFECGQGGAIWRKLLPGAALIQTQDLLHHKYQLCFAYFHLEKEGTGEVDRLCLGRAQFLGQHNER